MSSAVPAVTPPQPADAGRVPGPVVPGSSLVVVPGSPAEARRGYRVQAPGRVLRMWSLLSAADGELHQVQLPPGAAARLYRQLQAVTAELERSVSPALAGELHDLTRCGGIAAPTAADLRAEYATVLGWAGGLVIGMLSQIEEAAASLAS